jgi:CRP-like cAMP-binding protein
MYIIESVKSKSFLKRAGAKIFGYLGPGNFFGEIAVARRQTLGDGAVVIDAEPLVCAN